MPHPAAADPAVRSQPTTEAVSERQERPIPTAWPGGRLKFFNRPPGRQLPRNEIDPLSGESGSICVGELSCAYTPTDPLTRARITRINTMNHVWLVCSTRAVVVCAECMFSIYAIMFRCQQLQWIAQRLQLTMKAHRRHRSLLLV